MNTDNSWHDLRLRLVSASFLICISAFCIYFGNYLFTLFILSLIGVMHWELGKMLSPMSVQAMWFSAFLSMFSTACLLASNTVLWPILLLLINFYFQRYFFHHSRNFGAFYSLAVIVCGIIFYIQKLEKQRSAPEWTGLGQHLCANMPDYTPAKSGRTACSAPRQKKPLISDTRRRRLPCC